MGGQNCQGTQLHTDKKVCLHCLCCAIDDGLHCNDTLVLNHGVALHVYVHNAEIACGNPMAHHQSSIMINHDQS